MSNVATIRKALDEALREADTKNRDVWGQPHPWRQPTDGDDDGSTNCAAHYEHQSCCLDPDHGAYDKLLDYLAERVASK